MNGNTLILDAFWVANNSFPTALVRDSKEGKEFYKLYPNKARYLGWMDLVLLKDIIKKHNITHIILQNLDLLGKIVPKDQPVKVCVAYEFKRFIIHTISQKNQLQYCNPIYQNAVYGGWNSSDDDNELHIRATGYLRYLLIHTRVDSITCMNNKIKVTAHWDESGNVVFDTEPN